LTTVALLAPAAAGAVTIEELQAQINALLAQLSALQGSSTVSGNVPAACVGITLQRNLMVGSTGSDVKCLQAALNAWGYPVALSGVGSMGNETTYFGAKP
jgi:peptidoglycan hydrolase-like protein with peptidoglycan-binding domain